MLRAEKWGKRDMGRGNINGLAARGCMGQDVPGEQVEGGNTASTWMGGGGRWEWTLVLIGDTRKEEKGDNQE